MISQKRELEEILSRDKILFYGIGNQFHDCLKIFEGKEKIFLFDSNKRNIYQGKYQIHSPMEFENYYQSGDAVVISSIKNQYEIACSLTVDHHVLAEDLFSYTSQGYEENVYQTNLISQNEQKIREAYELLEDSASKEYWKNSLQMRITRQPLYLKPNANAISVGEYKNILELEKGDVIIDCGAYIGDTAQIYMDRLSGDCQIHALEPFGENFFKLSENIKKNEWRNVKAYHCAIGKAEGKSILHYEKEDFKMGISLGKIQGSNTEEVEVHTLDQLFMSLPQIDYLKMDIEGQEIAALCGAAEILRQKAPKLMISGYHKLSDFWEIPCLIKKLNPAYKIYVGHAPGVSTEVEYYCKA